MATAAISSTATIAPRAAGVADAVKGVAIPAPAPTTSLDVVRMDRPLNDVLGRAFVLTAAPVDWSAQPYGAIKEGKPMAPGSLRFGSGQDQRGCGPQSWLRGRPLEKSLKKTQGLTQSSGLRKLEWAYRFRTRTVRAVIPAQAPSATAALRP